MSTTQERFDREAAIERIARRMRGFDNLTLAELDRLTDESTYLLASSEAASAATAIDTNLQVANPPRTMSRADVPLERRLSKQALFERSGGDMERRRLLAGGAVIGVAAMTGAFALRGGGEEAASAENSRLATVLDLYRQLDGLDLDGRLRGAIGLIASAVAAARTAASALETGFELAGSALDVAEAAFVSIRDGLGRLEVIIGRLGSAYERLAAAVAERAQPVSDAVSSIFQEILNFLPPSVANPLREGLEALRMLADMVPAAVASARDELIIPLRATWLPDENSGTPGIREELFIPMRERVFAPGRDMIAQLRTLESTWFESFGPLEPILVERDGLRSQIAEILA